MDADLSQRFWAELVARSAGPMALRFVLHPLAAAIAAWLDGTRDAKAGRTPYVWSIVIPAQRQSPREWLASDGRVVAIAFIIDAAYQVIVFDAFRYPLEALAVAVLLAFLPYGLLRGPIARLQRRRLASSGGVP